jgi:hypothetical protein
MVKNVTCKYRVTDQRLPHLSIGLVGELGPNVVTALSWPNGSRPPRGATPQRIATTTCADFARKEAKKPFTQ